ncbi:NADP-dependent oxidoreductase [Sphingomonas endolithica]|uniref:NADP-dependent oxidoreductase n=1 Tax=Sphingomonas endolithica TaxID=2972485 RepID=UPI0021AFCE07|nr:NADP-dependent oxidoreductase [Sphingomonas sp. ZFBP2030]
MKTTALTARRYGRPDVLEYVTFDMPDLGRDTARIEVKAAGINPVDARRMTGELRFGELPLFFGTEYAGTIVALNADDGEWTVGDEALGAGGDFTHATIIDVPIANLVRRPPSLSWEVAGSLAGAAQTALTILEELGPVSSLLVHGGAGGVGSITIQLAREQGIAVVATGSDANQSYLRSLGAIPVVYGPGLVERLGKAHAGLFDASIDMAGSQEATEASLARVKPDGVIGSITATRPTSPRVIPIMRRRDPTLVERVATGIASSALRWEISATHDFKDARAAYEAILGRHVRGKSVLTF